MISRRSDGGIAPDEIFLDSSNLPQFNTSQFEGRIEKPISKRSLQILGAVFILIVVVFTGKVWNLQVVEGDVYEAQSENNRLRNSIVFSRRGVIFDRNGLELAWNVPSDNDLFAHRKYTDSDGFAHVLGYINYPLRDTSGVYYQPEFVGTDGVEKEFDEVLKGQNGIKIVETDALGDTQSESVVRPPRDGKNFILSIDARVQEKFYEFIRRTARESGFVGGAGAIMDIKSGELLALTSYPEFDSEVLSDGGPAETIAEYVNDERKPFLNRVVSGLYTPGSIVKPFLAAGALREEIIDPETQILSTGSISIPNPFFPTQISTFTDWKAHGYVDMRQAIGVSSNVYFYEVGGGFENQQGLGILGIEKYVRLFGLGEYSDIDLPSEALGTVPSPEWKEEAFPGDPWRIGDTYNTAIGQYGFQITPIQELRAIAAIANNGNLLIPSIKEGGSDRRGTSVNISVEDLEVVREGMRFSVTDGTALGLQLPGFSIGAKTGTAEVGNKKEFVHSWATGFFPYENPKYAFVVLMERAPRGTIVGSVKVARDILEWMQHNTTEYIL